MIDAKQSAFVTMTTAKIPTLAIGVSHVVFMRETCTAYTAYNVASQRGFTRYTLDYLGFCICGM